MLMVNQLIGFGVGGDSRFPVSAVTFDGTNDYMLRGANLTGIANGKKGIVSFWMKLGGGDGALQCVWETNGTFFEIQRTAGNTIVVQGYNVAGAVRQLILTSTTGYVAASGWFHVLASWDLSITTGHLYINNTNDLAGGSTLINNDLGYSQANHAIGATVAAASKLNADLAEFYFNMAEYLDLSVAGNRAKFISGGKPVDLGATGALPTGTQPIVYVKGPAAAFATNLGSGGNFTVTGTLTNAATSPSD